MIRKIDIQKFGQFNDFVWNTHCGHALQFKRMNIIYGRNYSGKTTLSRVFRCIEENKLHDRHCDAMFTIALQNGDIISQAQLERLNQQYNVRVYNTDFVRKNLSWLHRPDGSIDPFTVLGEINVSITQQVEEIESCLGNVDEKNGLLWALECLKAEASVKEESALKAQRELNSSLSAKAAEIKNDATIFNVPKYQINSLKADIESNDFGAILDAETIAEKRKSLFELQKPVLTNITYKGSNLRKYIATVKELVEIKISISKRIQELVIDTLLEQWVLKGKEMHKNKRGSCGFCGSPISDEIWQKLDNHFNQESTELRNEIAFQINVLQKAQESLKSFINLSKENIYSQYHTSFELLLGEWDQIVAQYNQALFDLIIQLQERESKIFDPKTFVPVIDPSNQIESIVGKFNELIADNNSHTDQLNEIQNQVRNELRISEVMRFVQDISYYKRVEEIGAELGNLKPLKDQIKESQFEIDRLIAERDKLLAETTNERRGAELVNIHLGSFFGHSQLKLVAIGEGEGLRFQIIRNSTPAFDLSEGETSLISFCYFMATIEDQLQDLNASSRLVIYIDDPISSLDSNHVFFMFSLVDTIIAKAAKYAQLFISTHSLDFFKYLKKLSPPGGEKVAYFLLESRGMNGYRCSVLSDMPNYLKEFVTEFNYLFFQIHKAYQEAKKVQALNEDERHSQIYSFSNNLRKFLECYLFYRFPNTKDPLKNIDKFFRGHVPSLVNRIINEYSHLTQLERGLRPLDFSEIGDCAEIVLRQLLEADEEQYKALCESVGIDTEFQIKKSALIQI